MALDREGLIQERDTGISGTQRIYRWGDWGLSLVNGPRLHYYPFAWEAAVIRFHGGGGMFTLNYATPLTPDVEVFKTEEETNEFIAKAREWFLANPDPVTTEQSHSRN